MDSGAPPPRAAWLDESDCDIEAFRALVGQRLDPGAVPLAAAVERNVPVYDVPALDLAGPGRRALLAEWAWVLGRGPGVLVLRRAYPDTAPVEAATAIYEAIIEREARAGAGGGDHFAPSGANARIWNALQKLCEADAEVYAAYFGNPAIAAVSEAWLGPDYQVTAQVNLVRPGGGAQTAHRDYHLGFMSAAQAARFPAHAHDLSPALTLQGAVAHCDMPVESGPTKLLPFSQLYRPGYIAASLEAFREAFEEECVQLPLQTGDALFFSPALFHAAGANVSAGVQRMANLLQVSSAFGVPIETVDRTAMCKRLYPVLLAGRLGPAETEAAIAATAAGYPFPTNLDTDPPVGGLAPESQAGLMRRALAAAMAPAELEAALDAQATRRRA